MFVFLSFGCMYIVFLSLRHRQNDVGGSLYSGLSVRVWVSLCVPKTLWTPYLKNQWREFHPISVTDVFGCVDMLITFLGQKVKVTAGEGITVDGSPSFEFHLVFHCFCLPVPVQWIAWKDSSRRNDLLCVKLYTLTDSRYSRYLTL